MTTRKKTIISILFLISYYTKSQSVSNTKLQGVSGIYKINDLLTRIKNNDTTYIVNFWATWCKPCVQELPAFDSLLNVTKNSSTQIILVSLDFKEDIESKVNPFILKKNINCQIVVLDEVNGNDYINKISSNWSGSIPATLIKKGNVKNLIQNKVQLNELQKQMAKVQYK